jgi:alkylhydroperoxidase/carboxymuconolactone decarboxylase family protein YurZ
MPEFAGISFRPVLPEKQHALVALAAMEAAQCADCIIFRVAQAQAAGAADHEVRASRDIGAWARRGVVERAPGAEQLDRVTHALASMAAAGAAKQPALIGPAQAEAWAAQPSPEAFSEAMYLAARAGARAVSILLLQTPVGQRAQREMPGARPVIPPA